MQCTVGKVRIIEMIEIIGRETTGTLLYPAPGSDRMTPKAPLRLIPHFAADEGRPNKTIPSLAVKTLSQRSSRDRGPLGLEAFTGASRAGG
ncbi:MAG TPA: hypothetical protein VIQ05_16510 [Tardiphaga sp.]